MKKFIVLPIVLFFLLSSCKYDHSTSEAFARYRHHEGVTSVTVPGWLIGVAARMGDLEKEERALLRSLSKVSVMTIDNKDLNKTVNFHAEFYHIVAQNPELEELLKVNNDNEQVTIFGKGNEKVFDELYILIGGNDNAIVHIKGKLKAEMLSDLVNSGSENGFLSWNN